MANPRKKAQPTRSNVPPAKTPEGREQQLMSLAFDLVEKRLLSGEASAQETVHFLKLASSREGLERKKIEQEINLNTMKERQIAANTQNSAVYAEALEAFRKYSGQEPDDTVYD